MSKESNIVNIPIGDKALEGKLTIPDNAKGMVLFAHGSGSSRHSPRNNMVADYLNDNGLATLLVDLLTSKEEVIDNRTRQLRFNIPMLADRLVKIADWLNSYESTNELKIGMFGSSTGAGAALIAAAQNPELASAVVSRGGRPDLAKENLPKVKAPTLLIVGEKDKQVIIMNQDAKSQMNCEVKLELVENASHLFEEEGTLEKAAELAKNWFVEYLG